MLRSKGRPSLNEAAEIDAAIRQAALRMLLEHGGAATMQSVAEAAGLSRKSVYARYPNKSELFIEVIRALLKNANALEYDTSGTAEDRLLHYIQAALATIAQPHSHALQRLIRLGPGYFAALREEMLEASRRIFVMPLIELLANAHGSREFVVPDIDGTARAILRVIFAETIPNEGMSAELHPDAHEAFAKFLASLLTRGLTPRR